MPLSQIGAASLFDDWTLPIMIIDRDYNYLYVNSAYADLGNYQPDQMIGRNVAEMFPETPERWKAVTDKFDGAFAGETTRVDAIPFDMVDEDGVTQHYFWRAVHQPIRREDGEVFAVLQYTENITEEVEMRAQREIILRELHHRTKNLLAIVQSITRLSSRYTDSVKVFAEGLVDRVASLARSNAHLVETEFKGAELDDVILRELDAVLTDQFRRTVRGPAVRLDAELTRDVSMAIHELATNAVKHGCFSETGGQLDISWQCQEDVVNLRWVETGTKPSVQSDRVGFGSKLFTLLRNINLEREFAETGMTANLTIKLP